MEKIEFYEELEKQTNEIYESTEYRDIVPQLLSIAKADIMILKRCYRNLQKDEDFTNVKHTLVITFDGSEVQLYGQNYRGKVKKDGLQKVLAHVIDIMEPIHPLGTVVTLQKQYLEKIFNTSKIEEVRVVIVQRFITIEDTYFTYAGVVYPVGNLGHKEFINFTSDLIESVIQTGYTDLQEETFVFMVKKELLIDGDLVSIGYATEEQRNVVQERMEQERMRQESHG